MTATFNENSAKVWSRLTGVRLRGYDRWHFRLVADGRDQIVGFNGTYSQAKKAALAAAAELGYKMVEMMGRDL